MSNYIAIDGGTTNTRIALVRDDIVVDTIRIDIGARIGIDNPDLLKRTIKQGLKNILKKNNMSDNDIQKILASGMITSEFGLVNLPHLNLPVDISDLHNFLYQTVIEEISKIPFVFVRGVKSDSENLEHCDMMRGEESELFGLLDGEGIYILPGSHSKIITVDDNQKIVAIKTMLTGEMISVLSQNTILKDVFNIQSAKLEPEFLLKGFNFCKQNGINESLFKVRVLKKLLGKNESQVYSFFMGVVLCDEVKYILGINPKRIIIGGKEQIKDALGSLLKELSKAKIEVATNQKVECSSTFGKIKIYEFAE